MVVKAQLGMAVLKAIYNIFNIHFISPNKNNILTPNASIVRATIFFSGLNNKSKSKKASI